MPLNGFETHRPIGTVEETGGFYPAKKYAEISERKKRLDDDLKLLRQAREEGIEFGLRIGVPSQEMLDEARKEGYKEGKRDGMLIGLMASIKQYFKKLFNG